MTVTTIYKQAKAPVTPVRFESPSFDYTRWIKNARKEIPTIRETADTRFALDCYGKRRSFCKRILHNGTFCERSMTQDFRSNLQRE